MRELSPFETFLLSLACLFSFFAALGNAVFYMARNLLTGAEIPTGYWVSVVLFVASWVMFEVGVRYGAKGEH